MAFHQIDVSGALEIINKFTTEELEDLYNSTTNERYDELVSQSDKVKSLEAEREMLMVSARSLAELNLAKQNDFLVDRDQLLVHASDSNQIKEGIYAKAAKLVELSEKAPLDSALAIVSEATSQVEDESEIVANSFLNSTIDYDTFVSQYSEKRKLAHLRRVKSDKLRKKTK